MSEKPEGAPCRNDLAPLFIMQLWTGMRTDEIVALTWAEMEERVIRLAPRRHSRRRATRRLFSNDELAVVLRQSLAEREESDE
jgi:integrase